MLMSSVLCSVVQCVVAYGAAAQEREVTYEEVAPVSVSGFAVGRADYDRIARTNTFTAGKIGVSLFKPVGDAYLFAQLTTALEDGASSTEIDNLLVSWTPQDRKSTRLNSSHGYISYAVFCLKKKNGTRTFDASSG